MCIYSHDIIVLTGVRPTLRVYMFEKWQKTHFLTSICILMEFFYSTFFWCFVLRLTPCLNMQKKKTRAISPFGLHNRRRLIFSKNALIDLDLHINGIFLFPLFLVFCTQACTIFKYVKEKNERHQSVWPPQRAPPDFYKKCTF